MNASILNRQSNAGHRRAFTLIELLVVIAIIGILASMLLPSLSKARETARRISCVSNIKQVILATFSYADNHKGFLPPTSMATPGLGGGAAYLPNLVAADSGWQGAKTFADYYGSGSGGFARFAKTAFHCPSIPVNFSNINGADKVHHTMGDYGGNIGGNWDAFYVFAPYDPAKPRPRQLSKFAHSASIMAFMDSAETVATSPTGWTSSWAETVWEWLSAANQLTKAKGACRHNGNANLVFMDGHAENKPFKVMASGFATNYIWGNKYASEYSVVY